MALQQQDFLRHFCLHILPPLFVKIRHFGILASGGG
jgi:Putative transposase